MRISGGELKGRKVSKKALDIYSIHGELRATSSKVRESIFNILGEKIIDAVFADLYAGTGAVGMEAMSRRAKKVYFIEADGKRVAEIEKTLEGCGCRIRADVIRSRALDFIRNAVAGGMRFDIVYLDPPYRSDEVEDALLLLGDGKALEDNAVVIAEHSSKRQLPESAGILKKKKTYRYGDTSLTSYKMKPV